MALRGRQRREDLRERDRCLLLEALELSTPLRREVHTDGASVLGVRLAPDEALVLEALHELGDRRRRELRPLREPSGAYGSGLQPVEEPRALRRPEIAAVGGRLRQAPDEREQAEQALGEGDVLVSRR